MDDKTAFELLRELFDMKTEQIFVFLHKSLEGQYDLTDLLLILNEYSGESHKFAFWIMKLKYIYEPIHMIVFFILLLKTPTFLQREKLFGLTTFK